MILPKRDTPEWDALWGRFAEALTKADLRTPEGAPVVCTVDDFMLMGVTDGEAAFKNVITRNYVYLRANDVLDVPCTDQPWHRGRFHSETYEDKLD